jgi:uncharacterized membrane protein YphA (DoxX/SURF4 family)
MILVPLVLGTYIFGLASPFRETDAHILISPLPTQIPTPITATITLLPTLTATPELASNPASISTSVVTTPTGVSELVLSPTPISTNVVTTPTGMSELGLPLTILAGLLLIVVSFVLIGVMLFFLRTLRRLHTQIMDKDSVIKLIRRIDSLEIQLAHFNNVVTPYADKMRGTTPDSAQWPPDYRHQLDQLVAAGKDIVQVADSLSRHDEKSAALLTRLDLQIRLLHKIYEEGGSPTTQPRGDLEALRKGSPETAPKSFKDEELYELVVAVYDEVRGSKVFTPLSKVAEGLIKHGIVTSVEEGRNLVYRLASKYHKLKIEMVRDLGEAIGILK